MHGVTTALVGFLFVCVIFPHLVKNRPQYYAAFFVVCLNIIFDAIGIAISPTQVAGFRAFTYAACAFLQVLAMLLLFLAAGGITWRQLAGDMAKAIEVIRRGEEEKEIIIPIGGAMPRQSTRPRADELDDYQPGRITINPPAPPGQPPLNEPHQGEHDTDKSIS